MPDRQSKTGRSSASVNERLKSLEGENEALKTEIAHHRTRTLHPDSCSEAASRSLRATALGSRL